MKNIIFVILAMCIGACENTNEPDDRLDWHDYECEDTTQQACTDFETRCVPYYDNGDNHIVQTCYCGEWLDVLNCALVDTADYGECGADEPSVCEMRDGVAQCAGDIDGELSSAWDPAHQAATPDICCDFWTDKIEQPYGLYYLCATRVYEDCAEEICQD